MTRIRVRRIRSAAKRVLEEVNRLLLLWALAATAGAAFLYLRGPEPPARTPTARRSPETSRLRTRVRELEIALRKRIAHTEPDAPAETAPADGAARARELIAEARRISDDWSMDAYRANQRVLMELLARDASAHRALIAMLADADDETAYQIYSALLFNPLGTTREPAVTEEVRARTRALLVEADSPAVREAAARVYLRYVPASADDLRFALDRVADEPDAEMREVLLGLVAGHAREVGLPARDLRPLVERLRAAVRDGDTSWAGALADWTDEEEDYALVVGLFRETEGSGARQQLLNALARDKRLVEGRVDRARTFLIRVMEDDTLDRASRDLALLFLQGYTPWDDATATAATRYRTER